MTSQSDNTSKDQPVDRLRLNKLAADIRENWQAFQHSNDGRRGQEREQQLLDTYYKECQAECNRALAAQRQSLKDEAVA